MLEKKPLAGRRGQHPDICGSHARGSTQTQRRRPGRPPSHLQSRWTRDRAVTAGALSHGTTAAHRCRRTACARTIRQPGQTGQDGAQVRTAAMEAGCSRASPSRCVLRSVTHLWADFVAAPTRAQGRLFTCLPQAGSTLPWYTFADFSPYTSRGCGLCVKKRWIVSGMCIVNESRERRSLSVLSLLTARLLWRTIGTHILPGSRPTA